MPKGLNCLKVNLIRWIIGFDHCFFFHVLCSFSSFATGLDFSTERLLFANLGVNSSKIKLIKSKVIKVHEDLPGTIYLLHF